MKAMSHGYCRGNEFWQTAHARCYGACEMHTAGWTFDAAPILEFCAVHTNTIHIWHTTLQAFSLQLAFKISLTVQYFLAVKYTLK